MPKLPFASLLAVFAGATFTAGASRGDDLPTIVARGELRVLVPYSCSYHFYERGREQVAAFELMNEFAKSVAPAGALHVRFVPTSRGVTLGTLPRTVSRAINEVEIVAAREGDDRTVRYARNALKYWAACRLLQPPEPEAPPPKATKPTPAARR